ncbi:MAG: ATP-binding protein [Pseudomonadota bacterium]
MQLEEKFSLSWSILADPTQIHQILMNLCTNAHHAMAGKRGVIKVTLAPVDLAPQEMDTYLDLNPGPYLKMSVKDSGYGMDPETLKRIFDPYFTTKEKGVGTGMGLAVVHGIVKNHGGAITVESAPGEGTTFNIFFPRIEQDVEREVKALKPLPVGTERILFVDDEDTIVELSKEMLERLGYSVVALTCPVEALKAFQSQPEHFDIVITDKTMPEMTGFELAGNLKKIRPDIPIILCTGFSETAELRKAGVVGITEMIVKPLVISDLARTVRDVLDHVRRT